MNLRAAMQFSAAESLKNSPAIERTGRQRANRNDTSKKCAFGVGISGREGLQAARSANYSIASKHLALRKQAKDTPPDLL
jgi:hypothetical protein